MSQQHLYAALILALACLAAMAQQPSWALREGTWEGIVSLPDPWDFIDGSKFTDEKCTVTAKEHSSTHMRIEVSFIGQAVEMPKEGLRGGPFYETAFGENDALVVQTDNSGNILSATHTSYDENGDINYGRSGTGNKYAECLMLP